MKTGKIKKEDVQRDAEILKWKAEQLIEACSGWLSAEEGNRNMEQRILERQKKEKSVLFGMLTVILAIAMTGCDLFGASDEPSFTSFTFTGQKGKSKINEKERTVEAVAETTVDLGAIAPKFKLSPTSTVATIDGEQQISGSTAQSFWEPVKYILTTSADESAEWTVTITYPEGDNEGGGSFNPTLKTATVFYNHTNGDKYRLCFDDYGKKWRWELLPNNGGGCIMVFSGSGAVYEKTFEPDDPWEAAPFLAGWNAASMFLPAENQVLGYDTMVKMGFGSKSTVTILGKSCTLFKMTEGLTFGVWRNTVYLRHLAGNDGWEATSVREGCPANAFTLTVDIKW